MTARQKRPILKSKCGVLVKGGAEWGVFVWNESMCVCLCAYVCACMRVCKCTMPAKSDRWWAEGGEDGENLKMA